MAKKIQVLVWERAPLTALDSLKRQGYGQLEVYRGEKPMPKTFFYDKNGDLWASFVRSKWVS